MVIVSSWGRDFPVLAPAPSVWRKNPRHVGRPHSSPILRRRRARRRLRRLDEVASGNAQAYHSADYYWKGKHPAWAYFTSVPFGLTCNEMASWIHHMGGQQLWDKLAGEYGLKCLPSGNTGVQMGGWFNKEINSADDLKGLKMRIPGLGGDVMAKLGASPVSLPGGQIYENLVSGAIEATEWVGPWNDYAMKFYEAAKTTTTRVSTSRAVQLAGYERVMVGQPVEKRSNDHRSLRQPSQRFVVLGIQRQ